MARATTVPSLCAVFVICPQSVAVKVAPRVCRIEDRLALSSVPSPVLFCFVFGLVTCATTNEVRLYVWPLIRIDCLYVEQEVVADDTPAVIAVMKADKARQGLT